MLPSHNSSRSRKGLFRPLTRLLLAKDNDRLVKLQKRQTQVVTHLSTFNLINCFKHNINSNNNSSNNSATTPAPTSSMISVTHLPKAIWWNDSFQTNVIPLRVLPMHPSKTAASTLPAAPGTVLNWKTHFTPRSCSLPGGTPSNHEAECGVPRVGPSLKSQEEPGTRVAVTGGSRCPAHPCTPHLWQVVWLSFHQTFSL